MPTLLQCSYMPGDSFAIAAWLAIKGDAKLIYLQDDTLSDSKSPFILGLYSQTKVEAKVAKIDLAKLWQGKLKSSPCKEIYRIWSEGTITSLRQPSLYDDPNNKPKAEVVRAALGQIWNNSGKQWPRAVTAVTGWLASLVEGNRDVQLTKILEQWGVATLTKEWATKFNEFLAAKNMAQLQAKSLVLWSRQSGKLGGAHLELDSSYKGISQLVEKFVGNLNSKSIILAGDERMKGDAKKLEKISQDHKTLYLGEFWRSKEWKEKFEENRIAQLAFWVYLNSKTTLIHLGMRSGNLEVMSLLKMTVIYLEPQHSRSGDRMTAFASAGIEYNRIQVAHSPGLTAQWGEALEQEKYKPAIQTRAATKTVWEQAQKIRAQKLRADAIEPIEQQIRTVGRQKQEAWDTGQKRLAGQLKGQQTELWAKRDTIAEADYSKSAKNQLKTEIPGMPGASRIRGFDPGDVDKIVKAVCARMK